MLDLRNWSFVPCIYSDLRLHQDTVFTFTCAVCRSQVEVPLGWVFSSDVPSGPFQRDELRELERKYGGIFQPASCGSCRTNYMVGEAVSETSFGAYRVQVNAVWQAPTHRHNDGCT